MRQEALGLKKDEIGRSKGKLISSDGENNGIKNRNYVEEANLSTSGHMDFEDEGEAVAHHQLEASAILTSNARPSRLANSMPHQRQLYVESITPYSPRKVGLKRGHNMGLPAAISSNGCNLEVSRPAKTFTKGRETSLVSANLEMSPESEVDVHFKQTKHKRRAYSTISTNPSVNPITLLTKTVSQKSDVGNDMQEINAVRMSSRASFHSDISQASRVSQETEEDVCFPMSPPLHTRVNGIDFDELEEYAQNCLLYTSRCV